MEIRGISRSRTGLQLLVAAAAATLVVVGCAAPPRRPPAVAPRPAPVFPVRSRPGAAPASGCLLGAPVDWSFAFLQTDTGCPVRWDPCKPVSWWFNPAGARRSQADVATAFDKVAAASGLQFVYRGPTDLTRDTWFHQSSPPYDSDEGRGIVVFWSPLSTNGQGIAGYGGFMAQPRWDWGGTIKPAQIGRGSVNLSSNLAAPVDPATADRFWQDLYLHEIGHAVGLDHVGDRAQEMYPSMPYDSRGWLGTGDGEGLRLVGSEQGCIVPVTTPPSTTTTTVPTAGPAGLGQTTGTVIKELP